MDKWVSTPTKDGYWWYKEVFKANGEVKTLAPVWVLGIEENETMVFFIGAMPRKFPQDFAFEECIEFQEVKEPEYTT